MPHDVVSCMCVKIKEEQLTKTRRKLKKKVFVIGLEKICEWVANKNCDLDFGYCVQDEFRSADNCISINTRQNIENQVYTLLHECGHLILHNNENLYNKKYPSSAKMANYNRNIRLERSSKYKVDVLCEEIDAWRKGKDLANRLDVYIDEEKYYSMMTKCVYSYVNTLAR